MRKFLVINAILMTASFVLVADASTIGLGSQSADVTVGEVDEINPDDVQPISSPDTGVFGLETGATSAITVASLVLPAAIIVIHILKIVHKKKEPS